MQRLDRCGFDPARNLRRWERSGASAKLASVSRGQEFVLDCDDYPEAPGWLRQILMLSKEQAR